jgi:hypothetical protein
MRREGAGSRYFKHLHAFCNERPETLVCTMNVLNKVLLHLRLIIQCRFFWAFTMGFHFTLEVISYRWYATSGVFKWLNSRSRKSSSGWGSETLNNSELMYNKIDYFVSDTETFAFICSRTAFWTIYMYLIINMTTFILCRLAWICAVLFMSRVNEIICKIPCDLEVIWRLLHDRVERFFP